MPLDWSILRTNAPVDIAGNFAQGFKMGSALVDQFHEKNALAALAQRPDDPAALATLYQVNPTLASTMETRRIARTKFVQDQQDRQRQTVLGELYNQDPNGARQEAIAAGDFDLAKTFGGLDEGAQKRAATFWEKAGPIAYRLKQTNDPVERQAIWQQARGILQSEAVDPALLDRFDPTNDTQLDAAITTSQKMSDLIDQNKVVWHQQGEQPSFATDGMGRPVGSRNPYANGGAPVTPTAQSSAVASTLSAAGLSAPVVAGFLGNFHVEGGYGGAQGDGGSATGIAQWRDDRIANFQRVMGKPPAAATPEEQAKFVVWEMQNPQAAGMTIPQRDAILNAKSPGEAASLIDQFYERSSGEHRGRRIAAAEGMAGGPVRLASKDDYDRLPHGTEYIAPDGSHRRKP